MKQLKAKILKNEKAAKGFYRMRIDSAYLGSQTKPGQFFEVRCSAGTEPLLRRPLGAHRISGGVVEMLYEIVGQGTKLLSEKKTGEYLDVLGPLGNGFDVSSGGGAVILVAGGIGVAPLLALAESLGRKTQDARRKEKIHVIIGTKTKSHILCEKEFQALGCSVKIATEDGSKGNKGLATDVLKDLLASCVLRPASCYACGPTGMLKAVAEIAKAKRIPCQVSLEERMACGVGVCLGCPVKVKTADRRLPTADPYKMVCKDGPVFNAEDIAW